MLGEDAKGQAMPLPPLCRYYQDAVRQGDATDHDIDLAATHSMDCMECRRVVGDVLQAKVDASPEAE